MTKPIVECLYISAISFIIFSCTDNFEKPPIGQQDIWECHHKTEWDEVKTRDTLIGVWDWEFVGCYFSSISTKYVTDEEVTIEFKPDSTLIVRTKDTITQVSTWQVVDGDADLFAIEVDPFVDQLWGRILFCDNRVEFNNSYADICDNYFKKRN